MNEENKPERLVIINKGRGPRYEKQFFFEIQEAILNGYRIADTDTLQDVSMRNYKGSIGRAVFYKVEDTLVKETMVMTTTPAIVAAPVVEVSIEDKLESLTKKAPLLALAKELDIEVPADAKAPMAIKKIIKDSLSK